MAKKILVTLCLVSALVVGQSTLEYQVRTRQAALPGSCSTGQMAISSARLYVCTSSNTWTWTGGTWPQNVNGGGNTLSNVVVNPTGMTWAGNVNGGGFNLSSVGTLSVTTANISGTATISMLNSPVQMVMTSTVPVWDTNSRLWAQSGVGSRYDGYSHRFDVGSSRTEGFTVTDLGRVKMPLLPSSNPGAGSKQLWYDPADGNRVKYAP